MIYFSMLPLRNSLHFVFIHPGPVGTMAQSEFQRSLHRLDSHKSSACVCGVSTEVSTSIHLFNVGFVLLPVNEETWPDRLVVFIDTGYQ